MRKLVVAVLLCGAGASVLTQRARSQSIVSFRPAVIPGDDPTSLPPLPKGKTTIIGGEIRNFDAVRDQFWLRSYGERPLKILFDERTQVYRNGVKVSVRDLGPEDHASVQTILDGANVFAVSIHILSESPEGECDGKVLKYDANKGELEVASSMSPVPVRFRIPADTSIVRVGESGFTAGSAGASDLQAGSLVSVSFGSDTARRNVARKVEVIAVPGAAFVFNGEVSFLDMQSGIMVLIDPRDEKSYQIRFDPNRFAETRTLRPQASVTVTATYDGTTYAADTVTVN